MKYRSKGFALITVLAVVIVVAALSAGMLKVLTSYTGLKQVSLEGIKAQYLAEAAKEWALYQCRAADGVCPTGEALVPMPAGDFPDGMTGAISMTGPNANGVYEVKTTITY